MREIVNNWFVSKREVILQDKDKYLVITHPIGSKFLCVFDVSEGTTSPIYQMYRDGEALDSFQCLEEEFDEYFDSIKKVRDSKIDNLLKNVRNSQKEV